MACAPCPPSSAQYYYNRCNHRCGSPRIGKCRGGGDAPSSSSFVAPSCRFGARPKPTNLSGLSGVGNELTFNLHTMSTTEGNIPMDKDMSKLKPGPDHLLVLVHGILASPSDWTYAEAQLKRELGSNFLIYASSSNTYTKTFNGIDGAGRRLADEVMNLVQRTESLRKISFLAHSLGGLFTRYAIAILYSSDTGKIAGLDPINFITLATPHLGVRGKKQLPFLLGVPILEKLAPPLAPIIIGRTGRQLFLTDGKPSKPPLLLRMTSDYEDIKFLSALAAFKSRIIYANVSYDHILMHWSLDGYKHVVDVEYCPRKSSEGPHFPPEAAKAKEVAQTAPNNQNTAEYHDIIEEEMIRGLQRVGWRKVDVSFHSAIWPYFAHNNIHVKNEWLHNAGAGVIAHVADSLKQQESRTVIAANL